LREAGPNLVERERAGNASELAVMLGAALPGLPLPLLPLIPGSVLELSKIARRLRHRADAVAR
jgi:hypothetical protein